MKNIEKLAYEGSMKRPDLLDDGGTYEVGYMDGFAEAQRQMHKCALLMTEPHATMYWLQKLCEWADADESIRIELKWEVARKDSAE